jgi:hypothetical protein
MNTLSVRIELNINIDKLAAHGGKNSDRPMSLPFCVILYKIPDSLLETKCIPEYDGSMFLRSKGIQSKHNMEQQQNNIIKIC